MLLQRIKIGASLKVQINNFSKCGPNSISKHPFTKNVDETIHFKLYTYLWDLKSAQ